MPYADLDSSEAIESRRLCNQRYYERTKESHKDKRKQTKLSFKKWASSLKEGKPCADCGIVYPPVCMDWHHLDASTKVTNVSSLVTDGGARQRVLDEIEKCELVCANCHRIRTWS